MDYFFQGRNQDVDSMLVQRQVTGVWQCRAPDLIPWYTQALAQIRQLRLLGVTTAVRHIYREHNAEADSLANYVIDSGRDVRTEWMG